MAVLPKPGNLGHNLPVLDFPQLSRKPALKTHRAHLDPTLRDNYENGMEATRAKFTRRRRQWDVTIDNLTPADMEALDDFIENKAVYGTNIFNFPDVRDPQNPKTYQVRFSVLPSPSDAGNVDGGFAQNVTFQIREV